MTASKIEWCTRSDWNPVRGCTRASEGCRNCYAEAMAGRFSDPGQWGHGFAARHANGGRWTGRVELLPDRLTLPQRWRKPARIFVNSTSDVFHESLSDEDVARVIAAIAVAPQHTFIIVTKRAERMRALLSSVAFCELVNDYTAWSVTYAPPGPDDDTPVIELWPDEPLPNLWLLVSVENQETADHRIPDLLVTPAAVRGVSAEPLLGPVKLIALRKFNPCRAPWINALGGSVTRGGLPTSPSECGIAVSTTISELPGLDWVIVGGESGPGARPMHPAWARGLRDQCLAYRTPFFFKQWGAWAPASAFTDGIPSSRCFDWGDDDGPDEDAVWHVGKGAAGRLLDGCTWDQVPEVSHG